MNLENILEVNAVKGANILGQYLDGKVKGSDLVKQASMAVTHFNKFRATKGAFDAIKFAVGRSISANQAELKQHIQANMPEYAEVKRLK